MPMPRAEQRKLLAKIVNLVNKIVQLIKASSKDTKEFKRLINQLSIYINALPWTDYGIKDFNRDIAWDEFIYLDEIVNKKQDSKLSEKIMSSPDFFELLQRLQIILAKEIAIEELENLVTENDADLNPEQKLRKSLYTNIDINCFGSRHKSKTGLKQLRTIAEVEKDKEMLARIQSALTLLSSLDMTNIEHRHALLGVICEIGEALKNLSASAKKITDSSYFKVLSTLRDELRHCADSPSKTAALQNIIVSDLKLFVMLQAEIKQQLIPLIDITVANYQYDNSETLEISLASEETAYLTISDIINPIKQIINEHDATNQRALALLKDFLNSKFLIPSVREAQLRFSENLLKIVAIFKRAAGLYLKQLKADKQEDPLAIETYTAELVKIVKAKISSEAIKIPNKDSSVDTNYVLSQLITILTTVQTPNRTTDRNEVRLKQAIDVFNNIAAQLKAAGISPDADYVAANATIQKKPALHYAIRFQLLFLASLLRSIYKKIPALASLEKHLDVMISIGNGIAHLQEHNRDMPPIEAALYGVKIVLPELENILAHHMEAKKSANLLPKLGLFADADKENRSVVNHQTVNPAIVALQSRVLS